MIWSEVRWSTASGALVIQPVRDFLRPVGRPVTRRCDVLMPFTDFLALVSCLRLTMPELNWESELPILFFTSSVVVVLFCTDCCSLCLFIAVLMLRRPVLRANTKRSLPFSMVVVVVSYQVLKIVSARSLTLCPFLPGEFVVIHKM